MEPFKFYSKPKNKFSSRVTVVGKHDDKQLKIAVSRCDSSDSFSQATGNKIALARLENDILYAVFYFDTCSKKRFLKIAKFVAENAERHLDSMENPLSPTKEEIKDWLFKTGGVVKPKNKYTKLTKSSNSVRVIRVNNKQKVTSKISTKKKPSRGPRKTAATK